ncbi:SpoU rRNA methylase family protein [Breznakibacter xylanolyticus]|uniref:SpoU rRNA methylase family protein n=1 Tax=Breznakibacter xylanolyticus TaxID=990 RepID=A0A2W7NLN0_9BACT|nr:RNA methyltransferase [Breznakibacter xylanolyticus]PZX20790.1 SpoU rRNA methylase family protein [Breznakibacter xylanolyticus]
MRKLHLTELNRLSLKEFKESEKFPIVVILDNIRSLHNVGSIFRTCDALRLEKVFLCGITATPPHNEIHKSALGAEDAMDWEYVEKTEDAVTRLREQGYIICSVEQVENSTMLTDINAFPNKKYAFIMGNEVKGIQQHVINMSDYCIEIPQYGTKHSFNVSVSAGIVLWEIFKQIH